MSISHDQNSGHIHNIKIPNKYFANLAAFKYVGLAVINEKWIQKERADEIRGMLATIQFRIFFSRLVCKNAHLNILLPVLYWCEPCFLVLREEHNECLKNRFLSKVFGLKR
jgi:hypothetical protein